MANKIKTYEISLTELYTGVMEIRAKNKRNARKKFWKEVDDWEMGQVMNESQGYKIKSIKEIK